MLLDKKVVGFTKGRAYNSVGSYLIFGTSIHNPSPDNRGSKL